MPTFDQVECVSSNHSVYRVPFFFFSALPLCIYLPDCLTKAPLLIHLMSHHVSSHCQLETAGPHSVHCVINVMAAEPGGHSCFVTSVAPVTTVESIWQLSIERDVQRLSLYTLTSYNFIIFLCIFSRWGSTSQTCMRTWGMDTTWFPCLRCSLELPWYEY